MGQGKSKVLIVNAPARADVYGSVARLSAIEIPVWAGILCMFLRKHGIDADVMDAEAWGCEETARLINDERPDLAVFTIYGQQPSASTQCLPAAEAVARLVDCKTLALGTHPSALPQRTLTEGPWTYVCEGEGPHTLIALCRGAAPSGVPGLWYRDAGGVCRNHPAPNVSDLDGVIGDRGFDLFDFSMYRAHNWHAFGFTSDRPYASLQTSLGCPFRCSFCCINAPFGSSSIRYWSVANVLAHLEQLASKAVWHIKIPDEMFVLKRQHVEGICDGLIERKLSFNFWAYARVDTLKDDALLAKMKSVGFNWLGVGIESGSKHVRDGVDKGRFDDEKIIETVKRVRGHGINVAANYIFGLPDDTRESMRRTLDLALELNTEWANFYSAMAYPGSALYTQMKGRVPLPDDPGGPGWIGYSQHAPDCLPLPTETLSAREVLTFRDEAFHVYFERPAYVSMIESKFGARAAAQVVDMTAHRIERRAA